MKYTRSQFIISFSIGALIAWSGVPSTVKDHMGAWRWSVDLASAVVLGGLYAVEKMMQQPHQAATPPKVDGEGGGVK